MPQKDTTEIKQKIISTIQNKGPSLPVHIARETEMSMLFASAFLSELLSEKRLKITNMKVGSSPIYYLPGQEKQLETYSKYLKEKEKEAFLLLQENKFLQDRKQEPAIRVALRSIKDFAKYFQPYEGGEGYWRYFLVPEDEFYNKNKINKETSSEKEESSETSEKKEDKEESKETIKPDEKEIDKEDSKKEEKQPKKQDIKEESKENKEKETSEKSLNKHNIFDSPDNAGENTKTEKSKEKTTKKPQSSGKTKEKPEFVKGVLGYLEKKNIQVKQEISFKKKEYQATIQVDSDIGLIDFFLLAKGKKKISTDDVIDVINEAKERKLYALLLYSDEIQNKAEDFANDNSSILKIKKIE